MTYRHPPRADRPSYRTRAEAPPRADRLSYRTRTIEE
jgi:hypothetical protein